MKEATKHNEKRIRRWVLFFMGSLVISGITAVPIEWEVGLLMQWFGESSGWIGTWTREVALGVSEGYGVYPFLSYGNVWLAFAHVVIALVFVGVLKDPVRNKWVLEWGMWVCVLIFPTAFIMGAMHDIPWQWQLIDCSFGVLGLIPLILAHKGVQKLENQNLNLNYQ